MKNVVFKLKFNHPNKSKTPKLNVNHFKYICKRPGAVHNKGQDFCCFGKLSELGYNKFGNINDFSKVCSYIKEKSKNKTTFYKGIISLKEDDALEKGFDSRKRWEEMIKNNVNKIAKQMGVKVEDFDYVCSVHMEEGHPHMHFMAWDKNQEILREEIGFKNIFNIRKSLTNYIFKEELQPLFDEKNKSNKNYKDFLKEALKEIDPLFEMTDEEFKEYSKELKSLDIDLNKGKIFNNKIDDKFINEIIKDIYLLLKDLPKKSRLNYAFMPKNVKNELDVISKKILASNIDIRRNFSNYVQSAKQITEFTTKNDKYINSSVNCAEDELLSFTGNQILNICKKIKQREFDIKKVDFEKTKKEIEEEQKNFEKEQILGLVSSLLNFMSKQESKNKNMEKGKSESLQAKKDLVKKLETKAWIDWENER